MVRLTKRLIPLRLVYLHPAETQTVLGWQRLWQAVAPPLAIALATTFFKSKFTEQERKSGLTNYVLGLSFITEGAIPFAAADPLRVLTSCIIGSAVAGGLTQLWSINVPAPHGGIFAVALANHALLFLLAVAIGSVISGLILGLWKKSLRLLNNKQVRLNFYTKVKQIK